MPLLPAAMPQSLKILQLGEVIDCVKKRPHDFAVMCSLCSSPNKIDHTSTCPSHSTLCCGTLPTTSYRELLALVDFLTNKRQEDRTWDNKKGFQRTPAFIAAVVKDALTMLSKGVTAATAARDYGRFAATMPRGGFTDVGLHTGGVSRPTGWPLVQQTFLVSSGTAMAVSSS